MEGNLIHSRLFLRNYLIFTLIVALIYFLAVHLSFGIDLLISVTDALISVSLLNLMLLSLWFVVRFARSETISSFSSIRNSTLAGVILVLIWLFVSRFILLTLFPTEPDYSRFLHRAGSVRFITGLFIGGMVYLSFYLTLYRQYAVNALKRENELKATIQKTRLQALRNQLNPHFVYNCLNSISSLTGYDPDKAREMLGLLSEFLRIALRQDISDMITLEKEIGYGELYLQIEKIRFEDKLNWEFSVDEESLGIRVPALILQPILENAVKHGVQQSSGSEPVKMISVKYPRYTKIIVENSFDPDFHKFKGEGIGLENIRSRLRLIYGMTDLLKVETFGSVFRLEISFPQSGQINLMSGDIVSPIISE